MVTVAGAVVLFARGDEGSVMLIVVEYWLSVPLSGVWFSSS
jgi:hypothetical protein